MVVHILSIILLTSVIQSLFGVGVLLFGTPLLLLFGHNFVDVLLLLLPISLLINTLQVFQHHAHIDVGFYRKIVFLTLPPIALFLFLVTHLRINISLVVGLFLLLIALKEVSPTAMRIINRMMAYEKTYFVLMGIIHGISNLGGSLLTAMVHHKNYEKEVTRATIAAVYGTFALVQLFTLFLSGQSFVSVLQNNNLVYLTLGISVFWMTNITFYKQIDSKKYRGIFAVFLGFSGVVLVLKGWQ